MRFERDCRLAVVARRDPLGSETRFDYDSDLNLIRVTDARGSATAMTYDARGNLLTRTAPAPLSYQEAWTYNARNDPLTYTDGRGNVTDYGYDAAGNLTSVTGPDPDGPGPLGRPQTLYGHDPVGTGLLTSVTDPRGKQTLFTYTNGNPTEIRTPLGNRTTLDYDASGRLTSLVDPRGNAAGATPADFTWTYTYNAADQLTTEADPLANTTSLSYDPAGNLSSRTDANGHVASYGYDDANRLTSVTAPDPDGAGPLAAPVTRYGYDPVGNLISREDANQHVTSYSYDGANRLVSITRPLNRIWTYAYDGNGNVAQMVDANGNSTPASGDGQTTYGYDVLDRLASSTYSDSTPAVSFQYDANGNRTGMADAAEPAGSLTAPIVDGFNRPNENPVSQNGAWDSTGTTGSSRLKVVSSQLAGVTSTTSRSHRVGTLSDIEASVKVAVKPGSGNQVGITLCNRQFGSSTWDGYRVFWVDVSGSGNDSLTIDRITNNSTTATIATATREYSAGDKLGVRRVGNMIEAWVDQGSGWTKVTQGADATYPDGTVGLEIRGTTGRLDDFALLSTIETYAYDALNRLTSVTRGSDTVAYSYDLLNLIQAAYPGQPAVAYGYDDDERLQSAGPSGQTTSYAHDEAGNVTQTTLPSGNGYAETRTYDRAGRLTDVNNARGGATLSEFAISLDTVGNPTQVVRTGSLSQTQTYTYDAMDRLTGVCFQAGTCPGSSDPFIRWTYDGVGNRLSEARPTGTTSYSYDAADRLTQSGSTSYTYDQNGNELSAGSDTLAYDLANRLKRSTQAGTTTNYAYDGDGKRQQASTPSQTTNYLWDVNQGLPQLALERDGSGAVLRSYAYGARRISQSDSSGTSYYLSDGLGSTANLTSASGATQWTWSYEPFGATRTEQKASGQQPENVMKFAGEQLDPTGLYHLRARQYDPTSGRFLTTDPVAAGLTDPYVSAYLYANNRPTVLVDPSGLRWCWKACQAVDLVDEHREVLAVGALGVCAVASAGWCLVA